MPKPPRFFISPDQVSGRLITVSGEDVRHIRTVLRKGPGDTLVFSDGEGTEYTARIAGMEKSLILAEIVGEARKDIRRSLITLGQGLPKSDKMDWIVQKATELGVSAIVPLVTERTIFKVRDEEKRIARWQKICREAAMQSSRADIPRVGPVRSFRDFVLSLVPGPLLLLPWEEEIVPIKSVLRGKREVRDIVVLIGPEGGFSAAEAAAAKEQGFQAVSLGPNILRTETAAIAALSMVLYETSTT